MASILWPNAERRNDSNHAKAVDCKSRFIYNRHYGLHTLIYQFHSFFYFSLSGDQMRLYVRLIDPPQLQA